MENENKILACVDQSHYADHVADYATWAARRMGVPLELLHVINRHPERSSGEDHSGAIGIGAQENLLKKLSEEDAAKAHAAHEQGRMFLNRLRSRAIAAGVNFTDTRQRHGTLEETLVEQEGGVRMLVLGRRGEAAEHTQRDLGRNVERVVRALHKPILTVTDAFKEPRSALFAFDGSAVTKRGAEMVAACPLFHGIPVHLLMAGKSYQDAPKDFNLAKATLEKAGLEVHAALIPGDPESVIAKYVHEQAIDLLIIGAYSHSPWRSLLFGSKTSDLLRSARIPTLLLRP